MLLREQETLLNKEEFQRLLTPERRAFILECIRGGLEDYKNADFYSDAARRDHNPRVRANLRNCHIVGRACRAVVGRSDIRVFQRRGRVLFIIADTCVVSFKMFKRFLRTANIPTRQAEDYTRQNLFGLDLPPEMTGLCAGYLYEASETSYQMYITCPYDQENLWVWKLPGAEITDFLTSTEQEPSVGTIELAPRKRRVRIRAEVTKQDAENG